MAWVAIMWVVVRIKIKTFLAWLIFSQHVFSFKLVKIQDHETIDACYRHSYIVKKKERNHMRHDIIFHYGEHARGN